MINITLYKNTSDVNIVDKTITQLTTTTAVLKEQSSIVDPTLILSDIDSQVANLNYIYIQEFNRYYYVNDIVSINNGLWEINCHCDVLMSFRDVIRQQTCIVSRQENVTNMYLSDPRLKVNANPHVQQLYFSNGFENTWNYCLVVMGN